MSEKCLWLGVLLVGDTGFEPVTLTLVATLCLERKISL